MNFTKCSKMMFKSSLVGFLLLLLNQSAIASEDEYFKKSIFNALSDRNGQFSSENEVHQFIEGYFKPKNDTLIGILKDKYSFKLNIGESVLTLIELNRTMKAIYLKSEEVYTIDTTTKKCGSFNYSKIMKSSINPQIPSTIFNQNEKIYKTFGTSVLLEILLDNHARKKESVACVDVGDKSKKNPKKCSISFNDTIRLDYNFVDKDEHTMYPEQIACYFKNQTTDDWTLVIKHVFLHFTPIFTDEPIVSANLPIGYGCERLNGENYPRIESDYGRRFEFDQDAVFNYMQKMENRKKMFDEWGEELTRSYPNKMYVDLDASINVADTIDEVTNKSIRIIYNTTSHLLHSVRLEDGKCFTYNQTSNSSLNWFYVQDSFVRRSELYFMKTNYPEKRMPYDENSANYSYLGEYELDGKPALVFEKRFNFHRSRFFDRSKQKSNRPNKNGLPSSGIVISTHYYPKDKNYWPGGSTKLVVPKKIEIRIFDGYVFHLQEIGHLSINMKSFNPNPKAFEKYDTSKCTYSVDEFIEFTD